MLEAIADCKKRPVFSIGADSLWMVSAERK
jgi:hypothetical protein